MARSLTVFSIGILAASLALSSSARADDATKMGAADALFEQGREAMASGELDVACDRFRESNRLDPAVGTRLNLADCEEKRGRFATAWTLFRAASAELAPGDERRKIAEQRARTLEPRVPKVVLIPTANAPHDMHARVDGTEFTAASFGIGLPLDPGQHDFVVDASGREPKRFSLELVEGDVKPVDIEPGPEKAKPTSGAAVAEQDVAGRRTLMFVLGGVGAAGMVTGGVAGVMTLQKKGTADDNCSPKLERCNSEGKDASDQGRTFGAVSTVGFVVGVLGLGGAAYLFFTEPESAAESPTPAKAADIRAELGRSGFFLSYANAF